MTDVPLRFYGPQPVNGNTGETLYTVDARAQKAFIRDVSLTNVGTASVRVRISVGSISDPSKRVVDQDITTGQPTFLRPLWLLDAGETLQGLQATPTMSASIGANVANISSATDATSYSTAAWIPAANTLYFLTVSNGTASGTTALNPSSITGNGTWTLVNQTTSTVAAAVNVGVAVYWWFSSAAGSSATTTVNFSSTQHSCTAAIYPITSVYNGTTSVPPWTGSATPIVQSAVAADTTAPASTTDSKIVTLATLQTGVVFYFVSKAGPAPGTVTSITTYTEGNEQVMTDGTGSVASHTSEIEVVTNPPAPSATIGPAAYAASTTNARASVAWEVVPSNFVNCMVSGIEVRP